MARAPITAPSSAPEPVTSYTTQPSAACWIHWLDHDNSELVQRRRKSGYASADGRESALLSLDPGFLDELAPARVVLAHEAREVGGRIGDELDALRAKARFQLRIAQDLDHLGVDSRNNLLRRLRRHEKTE